MAAANHISMGASGAASALIRTRVEFALREEKRAALQGFQVYRQQCLFLNINQGNPITFQGLPALCKHSQRARYWENVRINWNSGNIPTNFTIRNLHQRVESHSKK